ncbi:protein kinase domain-containing protein [Corallococcus carmarthensis]|uniref:serine/threonine-protein kinase n=1 Tax=Corallococcus carmarthensis TaxID=2316728 RepID=UPI00148E5199|nr:serine/threonine-protein kinase [Corallococcus carmarthensis]NOK21872.1 tetratricopeptide repeat protein [Corallococcus carmarthensis]
MTKRDTGRRSAGTGSLDSARSGAGTGRGTGHGTGPRPRRAEDVPPVPQVGRYLLLRKLGQGGMGVVYAAYDPDLDRKIALKLLHPNANQDNEEARSRLLREAQAMARVSHPNVIPVFDVGMWGDQVFVAMELVEGGTLGSWLKEAKPSWREVLERYLQAGRGLQAAHAAGLVHRDFKPANVLVSHAGRVYVTDFGLARQVGEGPEAASSPEEAQVLESSDRRMLDTTLTEAGLLVGTPNYMSPEQFRGTQLDARTDQFSFCAALYGALYGTRPFDPGSIKAYASASRGAELEADGTQSLGGTQSLNAAPAKAVPVMPPPALIREPPREVKVPGWVRQAVLRGLALDADARFSSMQTLLDALSQEQRHGQRKRWLGAAGAMTTALAVAGGVAWQQSQVCTDAGALMDTVWTPDAKARLESAFQATGKPFAGDMASRATQVLAQYASAWKDQRVRACEDTRVSGVKPEEQLDRQVVCLERRRKDLRATVDLLAGADAAMVEKSVDMAHALPALHECEDVESLAEQQRRPSDPALRNAIEVLEDQLAEVRAQVDAGRYPAALTAVKALEAPVEKTGYLPLKAEMRFHLGWLQEQTGQSPEASRLLSRAVFDAEAGRADRLKVAILNKLLYVEDGQKHFDPAANWGELAEATLQRLGGEPVLEADVKVNQANLAISQGHIDEARKRLEEASALYDKALPPDHPKRARTLFLLGRLVLGSGDAKGALPLLEASLAKTVAAVGPVHPDVARRHGLLSLALRDAGQPERALPHAQAVVDLYKSFHGDKSPQVAEALDELGMCQLGMKRYDDALKTYEQALALKRELLPAGDEGLQPSYDGVGQALLGLGRARDSVAPLQQAVSFASAPSDALAESGFALARALYQTGQSPEARGEATRARERFNESGMDERVGEVDSWLEALPKEPPRTPARKPPRARRR